jgi:hypothetical protein
MKMYKLVIPIALILSVSASAQVSQTAVQFLLIAPGARAGGMGETFVAISDDATAVHWNPAGLGRYPLSGTWLDLKAASRDSISGLVLVKNNLPETNYCQYDIWGLVDGRLASWDGEKWIFGSKRVLKADRTLQSLIERFTGLSESEAEVHADKIARANNELTPEAIDSLHDQLMVAIPSDYLYTEEIEYGFEKLHNAWQRLRIDVDGFNEIRDNIGQVQADSLNIRENLDKIAFGFDRAIAAKGDRSVWIPFDLTLPDSITCLGSDDNFIYVGTSVGLFRFDPDKMGWSSFTVEKDSLPSNRITAIEKAGRRLMFIGTDRGLVKFTGRNVETFPPESGVPQGHITAIAAQNDNDAWAVSENILYHYDGTKWLNAKNEEISIGEDLTLTMQEFYGDFGEVWYDRLLVEIARANAGQIDSVDAGQVVKFPYHLGYKGEIARLGVSPRGGLWIGTTRGVVFYDGHRFHQFGYRIYEVPSDGMGLEDIAAQFIPDRDPIKIEKLAAVIKEFNDLEKNPLDQGTMILVYANALGSEIAAVRPISSDKALVATAHGVVEYNKGKWSRLQNIELAGQRISEIQERGGELWLAAPDRVAIYAGAKKHLTFMHSNYLVQLADDLYYDYFSFVYPSREWGTFGLGITFLSYGEQVRTGEQGEELGTFSSYDIAFTLSYGTKLMSNLSGGVSLRYINSHLAEVGAGSEKGKGTGYSLAVDGGILYDMSRRLTLATTVTNIGPDIAYIDADQADPLPRKLAVGFNYKIVDSPFNRLSILGEANKLLVDLNDDIGTEIEEIIPHVGLEYWYSNYVALRTGYVYDKVGVQRYFTLGASLQYSNYRFDFSYIPSSSQEFNRLGNTMRFSMNAGF